MKQTGATEFVEENLKTIFAYALSRVPNREDAEDLTNDIVLAILQSADKIRNPEAFYGYVWGIAANTYRKFMRRKNRFLWEEIEDTVSDDFDFTAAIAAKEDVMRLHREIALLSKEYRECTIAYYYDGLSCAEVSKKLSISSEMVKYYLFKTRKILKEGICMEREFGEKSFHPTPFTFNTIFSGKFNSEYRNLFSRKLPGQILMSAYYTSMTARELAIELGVASVYLEDELAVLEKYDLITKSAAGKYQTKLLIFTEDFTNEFHRKAKEYAVPALVEIIAGIEGKLGQIRDLNAICEKLSDSRLLWGLLWPVMRQGNEKFEAAYPYLQEKDMLYDGAFGTNYGISEGEPEEEWECDAFAGYAGIDEDYYASAADFGILPKKNRYFDVDHAAFRERLYQTLSGEIQPEFMILTEKEETALFEILSEESSMMEKLYQQLFSCACQLMRTHAPKSVGDQIERIVFQTLFFRTVGLIGGYAVQSGSLALPDFEGPAALYIRRNTKAGANAVFE